MQCLGYFRRKGNQTAADDHLEQTKKKNNHPAMVGKLPGTSCGCSGCWLLMNRYLGRSSPAMISFWAMMRRSGELIGIGASATSGTLANLGSSSEQGDSVQSIRTRIVTAQHQTETKVNIIILYIIYTYMYLYHPATIRVYNLTCARTIRYKLMGDTVLI